MKTKKLTFGIISAVLVICICLVCLFLNNSIGKQTEPPTQIGIGRFTFWDPNGEMEHGQNVEYLWQDNGVDSFRFTIPNEGMEMEEKNNILKINGRTVYKGPVTAIRSHQDQDVVIELGGKTLDGPVKDSQIIWDG